MTVVDNSENEIEYTEDPSIEKGILKIVNNDYLSIGVEEQLRNKMRSDKNSTIELLHSGKWTIEPSELEQFNNLREEKLENEIQYVDTITILGNEKPHNEIQYVDAIMILRKEKPENEVDSITILSTHKKTLQNKYIDESNKDIIYKNNSLANKYNNNNIKDDINIDLKKKYEDLNNKYSNHLLEIINLLKEIKEKDKELREIKSRYPFELLEGEKMLCVIFVSVDQKVHYPMICKNTDKFVNLEAKLYEEYPNYINSQNYFMNKANVINKYKSLSENNINNNDIIVLKKKAIL